MADASKRFQRLPNELILMIWNFALEPTPVVWEVHALPVLVEAPFQLSAYDIHDNDYVDRVETAKSIMKANWMSYQHITAKLRTNKLWIVPATGAPGVGIKSVMVIPSIDIFTIKSICSCTDRWSHSKCARNHNRLYGAHKIPYEVFYSKAKYMYVDLSDFPYYKFIRDNHQSSALKNLERLYIMTSATHEGPLAKLFGKSPRLFEHDPWVYKLVRNRTADGKTYRVLGVDPKHLPSEANSDTLLSRFMRTLNDLSVAWGAMKKVGGLECVWIHRTRYSPPGPSPETYYAFSSTELGA